MEIIDINITNIDKEDICCAKSDKCATFKKEFLKERFKEGLKFKKIRSSGKAFIEYIPSESVWAPIVSNNLYFINCFWVSGKEKNKGLGSRLLEELFQDAKSNNKNGIALISSKIKKPYLNDGDFFKKKGFIKADSFLPFFELLYYPLTDCCKVPFFNKNLKNINDEGFSIYYTNACPFTEKYIKELKEFPIKIVKIESLEEAQNLPLPFSIYSVFYNGTFITNEILTKAKMEKLLNKFSVLVK